MNSDESTSRKIAWGPLVGVVIGALLFLLGAGRFIVRHSFGLTDALYCCLTVVPALLLLLVIAYVVQHAILASVVPLALAGVAAYSFPVFDVALGLALMGIVADSALSDWKYEKRRGKSAAAHGSENDEGK